MLLLLLVANALRFDEELFDCNCLLVVLPVSVDDEADSVVKLVEEDCLVRLEAGNSASFLPKAM